MPNQPEWQDAKSSMKFSFRFMDEKVIDGVGFGRLEVTWQNGTRGAYIDMNRRTYDEFLASESRGKFLNQVLKPGFKYERQEASGDAEAKDESQGQAEPSGAS